MIIHVIYIFVISIIIIYEYRKNKNDNEHDNKHVIEIIHNDNECVKCREKYVKELFIKEYRLLKNRYNY